MIRRHFRPFCNLYFYASSSGIGGERRCKLAVRDVHKAQNRFYAERFKFSPVTAVSSGFSAERVRFKSGKGKKGRANVDVEDESSDEEGDEKRTETEEYDFGDDTKIKTYLLPSIRIDSILKHGLNLRGRSSEKAIMSNRVKLNGKIINKKALDVNIDDKLEVTMDYSADGDPKVTQIGILDIRPMMQSQKIEVKLSIRKL